MKDAIRAKLPTAVQAGISKETYATLSTNPQCNRLGSECDSVCEPINNENQYPVEMDHIVPKSKGGTNQADNLQWLCKSKNREKHNAPDVMYSGNLYFDRPIDIKKLRQHQLSLGYKLVVDDYKHLFEDPTRLSDRFMLLAWMVGSGKTVGMLSILFGINQVRKSLGNGSAKRVKKVLWMVHQKSLVDALAEELKTELKQYNIADINPEVETVKHQGGWKYNADIIVACPQALWDSKVNGLTQEKRREILSGFDAIVVDEAHFAMDHYLSLCDASPTSYKFAVTATPMNRKGEMFSEIENGKYREKFVLFSKFGYEDGHDAGFYKTLKEYNDGLDDVYIPYGGGEASIKNGDSTITEENTSIENNIFRELGLINKARAKAEMLDSESGYSSHIMVRAGSITEAKSIVFNMEKYEDTCGVWSGSRGKSLGHKDHPWMDSKKHNGKLSKEGKRIVVTVDIGQFGINNKYCSIIVWTSPNMSLIELIQRIGRAIRGTKKGDLVRLYWNDADTDFRDYIRDAIDYILNSEDRLGSFKTMYEVEGTCPEIIPSKVSASVKPEDRVFMSEMVGELILEGKTSEEAKDRAVELFENMGEHSASYLEKINRFSESIITEDGRDKYFSLPDVLVPSMITLSEKTEDSYDIKRLCSAVEDGEAAVGLRDELRKIKIQRLMDGDALTIHEVMEELKIADGKARSLAEIAFYKPFEIATAGKSAGLPFESYTKTLFLKFLQFSNKMKLWDECRNAILGTLSRHFGTKDSKGKYSFSEKHAYKNYTAQLSNAMMRESERRIVLQKAEMRLILNNKDVMTGLNELYKSQLEKIEGDL